MDPILEQAITCTELVHNTLLTLSIIRLKRIMIIQTNILLGGIRILNPATNIRPSAEHVSKTHI